MKHISLKYSDKDALKKAIKTAKKKKYKSQLIQLFTALSDKKKIQKILDKLSKKFPSAIIIGTTTAGEISHAKMYDNSTIISLSLFQTTTLISSYVKKTNEKSGEKISNAICSTNTKASILLSEGLHGKDYEGFVRGVKKSNPHVIISGGLAGDNFLLKETLIFLGKNIYTKGTVGVSFSGKKLFADNKYNLNWSPIGKKFTITKAQGNIISEIDGMNAVEMYKRYLGEAIFANDAAALPDFQLLYKEGATTVARTPLGIENNALIFAAPIKKGQEVQFGFSNASAVVSGSRNISKEMAKNPAQAIFIYSCIARKTLLGTSLEKEFASFENIAPTAGFFTYGEFYSTSANNALLNCTTTVLVLSESKEKAKKKKIAITEKDLDNATFNALTHFIDQTSLELSENLELLNQYKTTIDMTSLISKTDTNGIITYINDNFCKTSQYSREELLGKNHNIVRDPDVPDFIFKKMWHNLSRGRVWRGLLSNKAKDGSIYYVDAIINPIFDNNNQIKEYIAIRQDVTKQIQSKKRIQEKETLIKAIFDNQDSIVIYASKTKGMISVNKKLFDYLDFNTLEQFKQKHSCICDLFLKKEGYTYPEIHPNWIDDIANNMIKEHKAQMILKDGLAHTFNIIIKKIGDEYIINLYDITELEDALKKAYMSEQAKSTFLANMSHEIRTPLNGILGFTDILTKKDLDKDSKRYVDIIHKSGQTLLNVVNDILDFSKLESGELSLYENESNLFEEMEAAVSTFASVSKSKELDYYTYIDTNIPQTLKCDVQRIKQVLNNLASNAIKFTPKKGEVGIQITLQETKNNQVTILFSVKDSGIGIAQDKIGTIFKAFSQADNSISREFGGTGLGLAISSQYIQMMGSELKVKSKEGKGSEFYFTLTLPIINNSNVFQNTHFNKTTNIKLLRSQGETCGINSVVKSYLDTWQCAYDEITNLEEVNEHTDILIVCAKLFDQDSCQEALDRYKNLHLIYIEGSKINFNCTHKKFHLIEQPMTGSALFEKIISLIGIEDDINQLQNNTQESESQYKGKILVAEDNETNQILISVMLEERGIEFKIVNNGQEAVDEALSENEYDLIFMDINMPVLDGVSATKILRKNSYTHPIVSLSANVIDTDIASFKEAGVNDTLNKPIIPKELDKILTTYLHPEQIQEEEEKELIEFDQIDLEFISQKLAINNTEIIKKLLQSFSNTAKEMIEKIEKESINHDNVHNIKGVAGNLRFTHLYELAIFIEKNIDNWKEEEYKTYTKLILSHLKKLIEQIEEIK